MTASRSAAANIAPAATSTTVLVKDKIPALVNPPNISTNACPGTKNPRKAVASNVAIKTIRPDPATEKLPVTKDESVAIFIS